MKIIIIFLTLCLSAFAEPTIQEAPRFDTWNLNSAQNPERHVWVGQLTGKDTFDISHYKWEKRSLHFLNLGSPEPGQSLNKWIYLQVKNTQKDSIWGLFFEKGNLLRIDMWHGTNLKKYTSFGNEIPRSKSWMGHYPPHAKLLLPSHQTTPILIHIENKLATIASFSVKPPLEHNANYYFYKMGQLPFYGCIIFLIIFNSILSLRSPKMGYFIYSIYHLFHLLFLGCQYGFIEEFLFPSMGSSTKTFLITVSLTGIFLLPSLFIARWFNLKSRSIKYISKFTLAACFFFLVGNLISPLWYGGLDANFMILSLAAFSINLIRIGIKDKNRVLLLFGINWGMHVTFVFAFIAYLLGLGESFPWLYHSYLIGVVVEALLFAFALSENQKRIQVDREKLIHEKSELLEKHYNELEEETAIRKGLIRGINHELRTPVNKLNQILDEKEIDTQSLRTQTKNLLNQSHKIIDLNALMENELEIHTRPFLIQEWIDAIRKEPVAQDVLFSSDTLPFGLNGDSDRIRDIIVQLLENAHKHADSQEVKIHFSFQEKNFIIRVSDQGPGCIQKDLLGKWELLKERNFLDTGRGLGMGMILVHGLSKALGATISFENPTKGLQVTLKLPLKTWDNNKEVSSKKILAVDDQVLNLKLLQGILKKAGHEVISVQNGLEAIKAVQNNPDLDFVFMDVQMPIMDGIEATQKIRNDLGSDIKIIALTANAEKSVCMQAGMNAYLPKPVKKTEVLAMVNNFL
jgi:CheY-like chemotaxis protein